MLERPPTPPSGTLAAARRSHRQRRGLFVQATIEGDMEKRSAVFDVITNPTNVTVQVN